MNIYHSSDYAGLSTDTFSAYYGYEVTDEYDNWCFEAKQNGCVIAKYPSTVLKTDNDEVIDCLLAGMGKLFEEYELVKK